MELKLLCTLAQRNGANNQGNKKYDQTRLEKKIIFNKLIPVDRSVSVGIFLLLHGGFHRRHLVFVAAENEIYFFSHLFVLAVFR